MLLRGLKQDSTVMLSRASTSDLAALLPPHGVKNEAVIDVVVVLVIDLAIAGAVVVVAVVVVAVVQSFSRSPYRCIFFPYLSKPYHVLFSPHSAGRRGLLIDVVLVHGLFEVPHSLDTRFLVRPERRKETTVAVAKASQTMIFNF